MALFASRAAKSFKHSQRGSFPTLFNFKAKMSTSSEQLNKLEAQDIFVQLLPIVKANPGTNANTISKSKSKILLCKWNSGNFKDRYTGLIRALPRTQCEIINSSRSSLEKQGILLEQGKNLLPSNITNLLAPTSAHFELVGCLNFTDSPACAEYIYIADISKSQKLQGAHGKESLLNFNESISLGEHSAYWFNWENIPFREMPADDEIWYPEVLWKQKKVTGWFTFGSWTEKKIQSYKLNVVNEIQIQ